jgi:hypothetical protein
MLNEFVSCASRNHVYVHACMYPLVCMPTVVTTLIMLVVMVSVMVWNLIPQFLVRYIMELHCRNILNINILDKFLVHLDIGITIDISYRYTSH